MRKVIFLSVLALNLSFAQAQILTKEDSLASGIMASEKATMVSGYGSLKYQYNVNNKIAHANLDRAIIFLGHKFNNKISFFSELEVEDAKVAGGQPGGEVALEQAFLKFNLTKNTYLTAGLFIPRIGITNENHLPTTFNGNDRTFVETFIIPSTWREIGLGLYGNIPKIPGLNYSLALVNGLNSAGFESGSGIREGRFEGREANASAMAVTGALLYYIKNFRIQGSVYYGGSAGLTKTEADSLQLSYGAFGTPIAIYEADAQYNYKGLSVKGLFTTIQIADAENINRAYANNTPQTMMGYYGEIGYNLFQLTKNKEKKLTVFARYENLDMNYKLPDNGIFDGTINQSYIIGGLTFQPIKGVTIKADYVFKQTGDQNPALVANPFPAGPKYYKQQGFFSLGVGYSF
jgi:hypothetical protein